MVFNGEYYFDYKGFYCLLDNDDINEVFENLKIPSEKRVIYFGSLPGKQEIEAEIQAFLKKKFLSDKEGFMDKYYSREYYEKEAQYFFSFYLQGYAGSIRKACEGEYFNQERKEKVKLSDTYSELFKLTTDGCYIISILNVYNYLFFKNIKVNGHIYFSKNDIYRINGSLSNFYLELKNGIFINFNQEYVNIFLYSDTNEGNEEKLYAEEME